MAEDRSAKGCDAPDVTDAGTTEEPLAIFTNGVSQGDYTLRIGGPSNWGGVDVSVDPAAKTTLPGNEVTVTTHDGLVQHSAKRIDWARVGQFYSQNKEAEVGADLSPYANSVTSIVFRARVNEALNSNLLNLGVHCVYPSMGEINISGLINNLTPGEWSEVSVPLQCLIDEGLDITNVYTPFLLYTDNTFDLSLDNVRWEPFTAGTTPDCEAITATEPNPTITSATNVYIDGIANTDLFKAPSVWAANINAWSGDPGFVTLDAAFNEGASLVIDAQYASTADRKGVVQLIMQGPTDLSALANTGRIQFDLKAVDLAGATGMVAKFVCNASTETCSTGDVALTVTEGVWETNVLVFAYYPNLDFANITSILEVLPI